MLTFRVLPISLLLTLSMLLHAQQRPSFDPRFGTCAIAVVHDKDLAVIVDSKLTFLNNVPTCVQKNDPGRKADLIRKDVLLVVTGAYDAPINRIHWYAREEARKLLLKLPERVELTDLDSFASEWFHVIVNHYRSGVPFDFNKDAPVSQILVATRINELPYIYRVSLSYRRATGFASSSDVQNIEVSQNLTYAGSCKSNVGTNAGGIREPAVVPPSDVELDKMDDVATRLRDSASVEMMKGLLVEYEELFAQISNRQQQCFIGPPYAIATWAAGDKGWKMDPEKEKASRSTKPKKRNTGE